jgi:hypothetical protein
MDPKNPLRLVVMFYSVGITILLSYYYIRFEPLLRATLRLAMERSGRR